MTITELAQFQASTRPEARFLSLPHQPALTFAGFITELDRYAGLLQLHELGLQSRVAVVLSQPLELAVALFGIAAGATAVPLYTNLPRSEYLRTFRAAKPNLLLSDDAAAISAASELNISVASPNSNWPVGRARVSPTHDGFLICSSGSTGIPKLIPRSESHFVDGNRETAESYGILPDDLVLSPLPLAHSFGLSLVCLGLCSGSHTVLCSPFNPVQFAELIRALRPSLLPLPPTMLQATMEVLRARPLENSRIRYIGSGASHLTTTLLDELEAYFGVPLIEGYGCTEVSAISISPLPPAKPKRGSVGIPRVPIRFGEDGEIVVQARYPTTLLKPGEWWHTGDLGYLDEDGYLFLTGRSREMINRGAEVIAPREIEEVLSRHPGVESVACYSIPHPELGEEVAATVVLRDRSLTRDELMGYAAQHLSFSKVPKQIVFRNQLELGSSGKPLRVDVVPPRLLEIWSDIFKRAVQPDESFFDLGGTSLQAAALMFRVENEFGFSPAVDSLFSAPTARKQSQLLRKGESKGLIPLREGSARTPLFFICARKGASIYLRTLVKNLPADLPCYGITPKERDESDPCQVGDLIEGYVADIRKRQPNGPYRVAAHGASGLLAYEVARRMLLLGEQVELLVIIHSSSSLPVTRQRGSFEWSWQSVLKATAEAILRIPYQLKTVQHLPNDLKKPMLRRYLDQYLAALPYFRHFIRRDPASQNGPALALAQDEIKARGDRVEPYTGRVLLIRARYAPGSAELLLGWRKLIPQLECKVITGEADTILLEPWATSLARCVAERLSPG
jgi:acyl-CoA synthetase (AMP-forming)/AMP-acid ligase II/thioesterase domain-containing protein/acyl carrier protein